MQNLEVGHCGSDYEVGNEVWAAWLVENTKNPCSWWDLFNVPSIIFVPDSYTKDEWIFLERLKHNCSFGKPKERCTLWKWDHKAGVLIDTSCQYRLTTEGTKGLGLGKSWKISTRISEGSDMMGQWFSSSFLSV